MSAPSVRAAASLAASRPPRSVLRHEARCTPAFVRIEFLSRRSQHRRRRETLIVAASSAINPSARPRSSSTSTPSPPPPPPPLPGSAPLGFSAPEASRFRLAVLGDLHYDPRDEAAFTKAQEQLSRVLRENVASEENEAEKDAKKTKTKTVSRLVQLGDLGASSFAPGTPPCFQHARKFLGAAAGESESFGAPPALVAGNHGECFLFFAFFLLFFSLPAPLSLNLTLFSPKKTHSKRQTSKGPPLTR